MDNKERVQKLIESYFSQEEYKTVTMKLFCQYPTLRVDNLILKNRIDIFRFLEASDFFKQSIINCHIIVEHKKIAFVRGTVKAFINVQARNVKKYYFSMVLVSGKLVKMNANNWYIHRVIYKSFD